MGLGGVGWGEGWGLGWEGLRGGYQVCLADILITMLIVSLPLAVILSLCVGILELEATLPSHVLSPM